MIFLNLIDYLLKMKIIKKNNDDIEEDGPNFNNSGNGEEECYVFQNSVISNKLCDIIEIK